jgi:hypothetical protein
MVAQVAFFRTKPIAYVHNQPPPINHSYRRMSVLVATWAEFCTLKWLYEDFQKSLAAPLKCQLFLAILILLHAKRAT